jgi:hypothetical protein
MSKRRKIVVTLVIVLAVVMLGMQFKQPDRTNPPVKSEIDAPPEVAAILERACYACHSNETTWPWYSYVAPVSWWVAEHVEHGRGDLNFSTWPARDLKALEHAFHEIDEQIEKGEMPLPSYLRMHPEARLSDEDRATLREWAKANS